MAAEVGTKRRSYDERDKEEKSDDAMILEKRNKCNYWEEDDDGVAIIGTKRSYERDEDVADVIFVKRYKCNYWEDPAYAWELRGWGSRLAQMAALDNDHDRFMEEIRAWREDRRRQAPDHHQ